MAKKSNSLKKPVTFSMGTVVLFVLIFGVIGGYAIWQSFAAPAPPATLTVSPNPGSTLAKETFTGCGYIANQGTIIVSTGPQQTAFFGGLADSNGCINISDQGFDTVAGTYYIKAWQDTGTNHTKSKVMGQAVLTIQ